MPAIAEPIAEGVDKVLGGRGMRCTLTWADSGRPCCDRPAAWAEKLACCGYVKVVCEIHHRLFPQMSEFMCRRCTVQNPGVEMSWPV